MNKKHITNDGTQMYVSEMDDTHLMNYILLALKAIKKIKLKLRKVDELEDKFLSAMYPEQDIYSEEDLTEMLNQLCNNLYPYIAELFLRDCEYVVRDIDVKIQIQEVFERTKAKEKGESTDIEFKLITSNLSDNNPF